ncbi:MAG: DNA cytosine methyltransferase [Thalassotalea sp.]|nr:DNA cytosine methyltransferase [Thalassotalea sp.]
MLFRELVVDNFAGGGGASSGIEAAIGRSVDIAINHDPDAIAMHKMNHPDTEHYCESVWDVNPREAVAGRPVGLAWFSPDCKHFSKAKGSTPVDKNIRGLAWVALRWAATVKPRVIMLENVEEFLTWSPVVDGKPCKKRKGQTFNAFVNALKRQGYKVDWRELRACDFGAPTIRKRLFLVARRDGYPIVWPKPTHGAPDSEPVLKGKLKAYRTAAEIIDWSIPCKSIFGRKRPLAENTLKRIAKGLEKFVFNKEPFIAPAEATITPFITEHANASSQRNMPANEPLRTICAQVKGGHFAVVSPTLSKVSPYIMTNTTGHSPYSLGTPLPTQTTGNHHYLVAPILVGSGGGKYAAKPRSVENPINTLCATNHSPLVSAFLAKHYTGVVGTELDNPLPTVTTVDHNAVVTSHMIKMRGGNIGHGTDEPCHTITAGGFHLGEVRAFLLKYYGEAVGQTCSDPLHTVPTKDRFGLVTVAGEEYQIVDIGMRMLEPHELFAAQGFRDDYIIGVDPDGKKISKKNQVARCGNAVCPPIAEALVRANLPEMTQVEVAA